jgi:NAD(P)-dependent dehydrogenase (short-subunit alcohol dehydrogenase family)
MEKSLENKVIIVTGGEGLLGREMVKNINLNGGIAISADISIATNLDKNQLNLDVTSEDAITAAFELVNQKFGKLDGIVNNAYPRTKDWGNKFELCFFMYSKGYALPFKI